MKIEIVCPQCGKIRLIHASQLEQMNKELRERAEWYRNEIIQALENKDFERVSRLEMECDFCLLFC